ncbi:MAG: hypothetical protein CL799_02505 [Chromatiales bacterium]|nr:hypothetical protein [Chromatiales bacterium]
MVASEDEMLEHGIILDWAHERTDESWFCFMDSDILTTGPCNEAIAKHLEQCDVFSSGRPLWHAPEDIILPDGFKRLQGSYFATADGKELGGAYFAIYSNALLTRIKQATGVGFRFYRWDEVPEELRETLDNAGLKKMDYDTGKLLMSLMHAKGARFRSEDLPQLRHLGGFSAEAGIGRWVHYRGFFDRLATRLLGGALAIPLFYLADTWYALTDPLPGISKDQNRQLSLAERRVFQCRRRKRINTSRYFNMLLRHWGTGQREPREPALGYPPADQRIVEVVPILRQLWSKTDCSWGRSRHDERSDGNR